jgi:RNA polymerase sigma-70 factor, ECF subfamily
MSGRVGCPGWSLLELYHRQVMGIHYDIIQAVIIMESTVVDEQKLIQSARQGDASAFNQLVLVYQQHAYNLALRILLDEKLAEDVTQESFLAAYHALGAFRDGSFRAWLFRIVTNRCYDELRRKKRQPIQPLEMTSEDGEEMDDPAVLRDESGLPEELAEKAELERAIQACIEGLAVDFRAVLVLVDVQGFDYQQACQVIQKPIGTLKSRLARARLAVQNCLQDAWELLPEEYRLKGEGSHE